MFRISKELFVLSLLAVFASFSGLGQAATASTQTIRIGNGAEPKDLDPHVVNGVPEYHLVATLFEGLVSKHPKTLVPVPGMAETWTVSKDGKVYTFKIRKNAKWSNGDPFTAEDFVYSFKRFMTPALASEYAYYGFYVKNAKNYYEGKLKDPSQLGYKALDPYTVQITLENPLPFFLSLLDHYSYFPVHKASIDKYGAKWTRSGNMVSNGAYMLDKWETNKIITMKKNPHYWDKNTVSIDTVNFYPTENIDTEEKMFRSGELDITNEVPLEKIPYWQKDKTGVYHQEPFLGSYFYWINVTKPPMNNKLVRKALALGFDRERLIKYVLRGGQLPGQSLTPPGTAGYQPPTGQIPKASGQIEKAKQLLKEAGYPNGKGLPTIEILYNTHEGHKKIAEAIQQMWKQNLGVDVKLFNQEWKVYIDTARVGNFQLARFGWIGDYNDPTTFLELFLTGGGNNNSRWSNKQFDDNMTNAAKELNPKKRLDFFKKAEEILLDELPFIPIYMYTRVYLMKKTVQGWYPNIEDRHPLKHVKLVTK